MTAIINRSFFIISIIGFLGLSAFSLLSCASALEWSDEGASCASGECLKGYSCLGGDCIPDDALKNGETCRYDRQCDGSLICTSSGFMCAKPCAASDFYTAPTSCATSYYCQPFLVSNTDGNGVTSTAYEGVCVASSACTIAEDCGGNDNSNAGSGVTACIKMSDSVSVCMSGCSVSTTSPVYEDNCGSISGAQSYCQPIGSGETNEMERRLVCLDTHANAQLEGNACDFVSNPCQIGLACVGGVCRSYCTTTGGNDTVGDCSGGNLCCASTKTGDAYSVCAGTCSGI